METRSGRRLSSPPPPHRAPRRRGPQDADLISALPDDILLLLLVRLPSVRAAARTGILSRRWRGLWTQLPDLTFRRVRPARIESALARFAASPAVSLIDICTRAGHTAAQANSLLRAAAVLSPAELLFSFPGSRGRGLVLSQMERIGLPCFHRTTSIKLETWLCVLLPTAGEFTALERLSLNAGILDLGTLLNRCPRLRLLSATSKVMLLLTPHTAGELPALESLALDGNIVDLATFLNRCPRLRNISITFRNVASSAHKAALATLEAVAAHGVSVSLLGIHLSSEHGTDATLLRAAARLSPQELIFTHLVDTQLDPQYRNVELPCFPHAVSIKIAVHYIRFTRLLDGKFSELERMILKGCIIDDLGTLVSLCPRLRVLKVKATTSKCDITIHSTSLQELVLGPCMECRGVDIVSPMLKQLTMDVQADKDVSLSISAPMLENVSWELSYTGLPIVFGFWHLHSMDLERQGLVTKDHALYVYMYALDSSGAELDFAQEIDKVLITDFSVLNLRLGAMGHVYGAALLRLLSVLQVHTGLKILTVSLLNSGKSEEAQACSGNCPCDSPKIWRSQSISMIHLEEVEIKGLKGEDHEFDALKLILRCAPFLKRMTVELENVINSHGHGGCAKEINIISLEYPSVDFHVSHSGRLVPLASSSCS